MRYLLCPLALWNSMPDIIAVTGELGHEFDKDENTSKRMPPVTESAQGASINTHLAPSVPNPPLTRPSLNNYHLAAYPPRNPVDAHLAKGRCLQPDVHLRLQQQPQRYLLLFLSLVRSKPIQQRSFLAARPLRLRRSLYSL